MFTNTRYYNCASKLEYITFTNELTNLLDKYSKMQSSLIILCIGTDKVTGDSLGPFVGHHLSRNLSTFLQDQTDLTLPYIKLYGTLAQPVHALNLEETIQRIKEDLKQNHLSLHNSTMLVVDASLGYANHLGYVTLCEKALAPGEGVNKKLPRVGQISITGIIGESHGSVARCQSVLKQTRLFDLIQLSDFISDGIFLSILRLYQHVPNYRLPHRIQSLLL